MDVAGTGGELGALCTALSTETLLHAVTHGLHAELDILALCCSPVAEV